MSSCELFLSGKFWSYGFLVGANEIVCPGAERDLSLGKTGPKLEPLKYSIRHDFTVYRVETKLEPVKRPPSPLIVKGQAVVAFRNSRYAGINALIIGWVYFEPWGIYLIKTSFTNADTRWLGIPIVDSGGFCVGMVSRSDPVHGVYLTPIDVIHAKVGFPATSPNLRYRDEKSSYLESEVVPVGFRDPDINAELGRPTQITATLKVDRSSPNFVVPNTKSTMVLFDGGFIVTSGWRNKPVMMKSGLISGFVNPQLPGPSAIVVEVNAVKVESMQDFVRIISREPSGGNLLLKWSDGTRTELPSKFRQFW